ncbi:MAG: class III signal peptide-containing protein [Endomicrobium sp.]|jgi:Flp pilus assembly pilin Flp|nr:class III signal peptide-containing protein [Endomicrobium sp.]
MINFNWIKKNKGQGMVEYILIVAVVVGIVFVAYRLFGRRVKAQFENAARTVQSANA